jgi:hypothetical protein
MSGLKPGDLLQEADEWREYVAHDVIVDLPQHIEDWRTAYDWGRRREAYVQSRAEVHAHVLVWIDGIEGVGTPPSYLCAAFHGVSDPLQKSAHYSERDVLRITGRPAEPLDGCGDDVQHAMLVESIEFVEPPEGIVRKRLPSVVRLQPLDDCLGSRIDPANLAATRAGEHLRSGAKSHLVSVTDDREFGVLLDLIGERFSKRRREFEREMVERRTEALQAVPDQEPDLVGRQRVGVDPSCARESFSS